MNDPLYNRMRETGWRRKLTEDEAVELCAWLAGHPETRADWELEEKLNAALDGLKDSPVPSNFTARVLQAIEREATPAARRREQRRHWFWHSLLPKAAFAAVLLVVGLVAYHRTELATRRVKLAQSVVTVSEITSVPSPEILQAFEEIRQMPATPAADPGLLAVFSLLQ